jgi:hypothetical protein
MAQQKNTYVNVVATLGAAGGVAYVMLLYDPSQTTLALIVAAAIILIGLGITSYLHFNSTG